MAAYHTTIHRLTAQVEHLQERGARAETEAAAQMTAVQTKDAQLLVVQQQLRRFITRMHEVRKDFTAADAAATAAEAGSDPHACPFHFCATVAARLSERIGRAAPAAGRRHAPPDPRTAAPHSARSSL